MEEKQIEIVVLLEITGLKDKEKFEKHISKEGFEVIANENFVYTGKSTTTTFSTKAYILEVFKEGLKRQDFDGKANMIFLLNEIAYPPYYYDKSIKEFEESKEEK